MTNEITNIDQETGELLNTGDTVIQDTEEFTIYKQPNGKFRKEMKYKKYFSHVPETQEEITELFKVLNTDDSENITPMARAVNKELEIHQVYTNPYQSFDETTGSNVNGVTTTIFDGNEYFVTSSKAVYYTVFNLFNVFGHPHDAEYKPIKVKITSTKMTNGHQINLSLV